MKKTLSMLLLVLFAVGLLVSCNADAVSNLFKDKIQEYTVTFDLQGRGSAIDPKTNIASGSTISEPEAPTADGFIFYGWYQEAECTNKWNFDTDEVTGNITLYARWVESTIAGILSTVEGFPISSSQSEVPDNAWTARNGNKCYRIIDSLCFIPTTIDLKGVGISANVVKSGNDYICNPQVDLTVTFHMTGDVLTSITFTGDSTFEGTYTAPVTYTVTFDLNGIAGTAPEAKIIKSGENVTKPADPTKGGYTFDGWYKEVECTNEWKFDTDTVTKDTTLYAKWVPEGFVDLGVKNSSGKPLYWAKCNLGATKAEDYGYYYAWASTTGYTYDGSKWVDKDNTEIPPGGFNTENAPHYIPGTIMEYSKYIDSATLESSDDAATVKNSKWRMPTSDEFVELFANCVWIWTSDYNSTGKSGYVVYKAKNNDDKGKANMNDTWKKWNGSSYGNDSTVTGTYSISDPHHIFLPAAGYVTDVTQTYKDMYGYYWSSSHTGAADKNSSSLIFLGTNILINPNSLRNQGFSIRPVRED